MSDATPSCWLIIPVKASGGGKSRLSGVLAPALRHGLVVAMLDRVIAAAQGCEAIDRICLVNNTPSDRWGSHVAFLADPGGGLNPALKSALAHVAQGTPGLVTAASHAAPDCAIPNRLIIVAGDLPLLLPADFTMLARLPDDTIAIAPDRHGTGTNALSLPCSALGSFSTHFGLGSHFAHRAEAARLEYQVETILSTGLAKDIDEPTDLRDAQGCLQEAL